MYGVKVILPEPLTVDQLRSLVYRLDKGNYVGETNGNLTTFGQASISLDRHVAVLKSPRRHLRLNAHPKSVFVAAWEWPTWVFARFYPPKLIADRVNTFAQKLCVAAIEAVDSGVFPEPVQELDRQWSWF